MTLRRLNIEIQGFPESYAAGPQMFDNMVVGEPHPLAVHGTGAMSHNIIGEPESRSDGNTNQGGPSSGDPGALQISPRASPVGEV